MTVVALVVAGFVSDVDGPVVANVDAFPRAVDLVAADVDVALVVAEVDVDCVALHVAEVDAVVDVFAAAAALAVDLVVVVVAVVADDCVMRCRFAGGELSAVGSLAVTVVAWFTGPSVLVMLMTPETPLGSTQLTSVSASEHVVVCELTTSPAPALLSWLADVEFTVDAFFSVFFCFSINIFVNLIVKLFNVNLHQLTCFF